MNPLDFVERLFSSIGSVFSRIGYLYQQGSDTARKPWLRRIVVTLVLLVVLAGLVFLGLALVPLVPMRFWQVLAICLVALVVLWWFTSGQRKASLKGRTRKRIGDLGPGNAEDEREPLQRMGAAIAEAKRTIARSPDIDKGRAPLYRIPWLLFVGDQAADVDGLLRAGCEVSPFPPPDKEEMDPDDVWRWWFFKSMIAIEMHPRVVADTNARLDRGLWYQSLMKLADEREKLPLNGIVVAVAAQSLLGPAERLKDTATRLRRLVDEAMEHLQVQMPVYFVVSGLDRLPGYAQVRATLPAEAFAQALGHRFADSEVVSAASSGRVDEILKPIEDRLHALRMTALRAQATATQRRAVFDFVESLRQAQQGLSLFVTLMLEDNPFQRTPRWRGLYFAGSADAAHRGGAFVADLFTRFLPSDQPLAGAPPSIRRGAVTRPPPPSHWPAPVSAATPGGWRWPGSGCWRCWGCRRRSPMGCPRRGATTPRCWRRPAAPARKSRTALPAGASSGWPVAGAPSSRWRPRPATPCSASASAVQTATSTASSSG